MQAARLVQGGGQAAQAAPGRDTLVALSADAFCATSTSHRQRQNVYGLPRVRKGVIRFGYRVRGDGGYGMVLGVADATAAAGTREPQAWGLHLTHGALYTRPAGSRGSNGGGKGSLGSRQLVAGLVGCRHDGGGALADDTALMGDVAAAHEAQHAMSIHATTTEGADASVSLARGAALHWLSAANVAARQPEAAASRDIVIEVMVDMETRTLAFSLPGQPLVDANVTLSACVRPWAYLWSATDAVALEARPLRRMTSAKTDTASPVVRVIPAATRVQSAGQLRRIGSPQRPTLPTLRLAAIAEENNQPPPPPPPLASYLPPFMESVMSSLGLGALSKRGPRLLLDDASDCAPAGSTADRTGSATRDRRYPAREGSSNSNGKGGLRGKRPSERVLPNDDDGGGGGDGSGGAKRIDEACGAGPSADGTARSSRACAIHAIASPEAASGWTRAPPDSGRASSPRPSARGWRLQRMLSNRDRLSSTYGAARSQSHSQSHRSVARSGSLVYSERAVAGRRSEREGASQRSQRSPRPIKREPVPHMWDMVKAVTGPYADAYQTL